MRAAGIRVVVRSGDDPLVAGQRRDLRRRGRIAVRAMAPALAALVVAQVLRLAGGPVRGRSLVLVLIASVAVVGTLTAGWLWAQKRRSSTYPGRLWSSRLGFYPGPYDDQPAPAGLRGSAAFAERHRGDGVAPVVRLVLTGEAIAIVPSRGPNDPMVLPLIGLSAVTLVHGDRRTRGVSLTTSDGRTATFLMEPDDALASALQRLGAVVEHR